MNILLTGSSGFLGKTIQNNIKSVYPATNTLGRSSNDEIYYDFATNLPFKISAAFDLIIHCAGKAHMVPRTKNDADLFFKINVDGTKRLLQALSDSPQLPKYFVFISTVAVYGKETGELISEDEPLSAVDPYGLSKIQAEILVKEWCNRNNVTCTIFRLPLIAGKNPPGNLKSMIQGIDKGYYFNINHGSSRKSIVMADDIAVAILNCYDIGGIYNLTDRRHPTFNNLSQLIALQLRRNSPKNIPLWMAKCMAILGDLMGGKAPLNSNKLNKILNNLTFDDNKAVEAFNWHPKEVLKSFQIR